ncbi:DUF4330 family protein [Prochlorococcus sp. MIT 1300]|uniref:DUF4330 family protein n=1 Tax=Prochlorococcus sp. MIT 1300 TaxID=3096218 RepID=UPI002A7658C5|nr:DUF4330 family protein [Prochlorococcus sp. MIT 1300]
MTNRIPIFKQITLFDFIVVLFIGAGLSASSWSPMLYRKIFREAGTPTSVLFSIDLVNVPAANPSSLYESILSTGKTSLSLNSSEIGDYDVLRIIRPGQNLNHLRSGPVNLDLSSQDITRSTVRIILSTEANVSNDGVSLHGEKLKIGTKVLIEGLIYKLQGVISDVSVK